MGFGFVFPIDVVIAAKASDLVVPAKAGTRCL
jgi:hypothetical protein